MSDTWMQIPVSEFEHLHAEVRRLRDGWNYAEAHIAKLQVEVHDLKNDLTATRMQHAEGLERSEHEFGIVGNERDAYARRALAAEAEIERLRANLAEAIQSLPKDDV